MLEDRGMPMDDSHFNLPTERLGLPGGGLSYLNFVAILEGKGILTQIKHKTNISWKIQSFSLSRLLVK